MDTHETDAHSHEACAHHDHEDRISGALMTLAGVIFVSALIIAGSTYLSAKMLEKSLASLPAPTGVQANTNPTPSPTGANAPTQAANTDTSLSYIGGTITVNSSEKPAGTSPDLTGVTYYGNKDAKVTVVEYSDYECPFCHKFYVNSIVSFKKDYIDTGKVKFVYKDFPLYSIHPKALPAANAARCAGDQGKYYDMHNALFDKYESWVGTSNLKESLTQIASGIGLDKGKFESCLTEFKYKDAIQKDYTEGYYLGVRGTPSTFINGKMVVNSEGTSAGSMDYATLKAELDKALAE